MPISKCKLCHTETELVHSHVVPAFAFKWLKKSSGDGNIRLLETPNQRVQDGEKRYWLCSDCEGILNKSETLFSRDLFHPYMKDSGKDFHYSSWLLHFCTSLSWRVLHLYLEDNHLSKWSKSELQLINKAENVWRRYLLGQKPHPEQYRQHLIPLDRIESTNAKTVPNINRYLMRAIDTDICKSESSIFTYTKIGRFITIGIIKQSDSNYWQGSKINANKGVVKPRNYKFHRAFWEYILEKAERAAKRLGSISNHQQEKIDYAFKKNVDKYIKSDAFEAMKADVNAFGKDAFYKK